MKIAIIAPYKRVAPHFETELEIAQRHLDEGDEVEYVSCVGHLTNCDFNSSHDKTSCDECVGRQQAGLKKLDQKISVKRLEPIRSVERHSLPAINSVTELMALKIDNFDIGYACLSSLVSAIRNPEPNIDEHRQLLERFYQSGITTYQYTCDYICKQKPDRVYVFNGRFCAMRAILRACQRYGVQCAIHERGFDKDHYQLYVDHLPHDIAYIQTRIHQQWNSAESAPDREKVGAQWFEGRKNRVETNWQSFVKEQQIGQLPDGFDPSKRNMAIFVSSEDEFVSIGDQWKHPIYENQVDGIRRILGSFKQEPDFHFYLRVHPNLKGLDNSQTKSIAQLNFSNLTTISAESTVDTYQLISACEKTISFGSSVGIEATYWDRPSILLGACLYRNFGSTYEPETHQQAVELIEQELKPKSKDGALKYGFWFQSHGTRYKYFAAQDLFSGTFKGEEVFPATKLSIPRKIESSFRKLLIKLNLKKKRAAQ